MNKVAIITGAAKRIGAAIANQLHDSGIDILIHCNDSHIEAKNLVTELNSIRSDSAKYLSLNLLEQNNFSRLIKACIDQFGRLDVLINNASTFYPTPLEIVEEHQWDDLMDVNVKAPFFLIKEAADELKKTNGCIINITDIHGEKPLRNYSIYSTSKAALIMLTKAMAKELAPDIRVNAISPGAIDWPETMDDTEKRLIIKKIVLNKQGSEKDISNAVLFLINQANYITGQIISIDGGRLLNH